MILMGANPFRGPLEEWTLKIFFETFLGSEMATSEASAICVRKSPPSNDPSNGFTPIKISKYECHVKNRYIDNFMYISFDTAVFGILYCMFAVLSDFQGPPLPMALSSPSLPQTAPCTKKLRKIRPQFIKDKTYVH